MADDNGHMDPADFAALMGSNGNGFGGGGLWCFLLIILFFIGALGFNGQPAPAPQQQGNGVLDATLAAAGAQGGFVTQSDLDSTVRMQSLQQGQRDITDNVNQNKYDLANALSSTEARLTSSVSDLRANQQANAQAQQACCNDLKYAGALNTSSINETTVAQGQRVLDRLDRYERDRQAERVADRDRRISQLEGELAMQRSQAQNAQQFGAINSRLDMMPTYPNAYAYSAGPSPFCQCGQCCAA